MVTIQQGLKADGIAVSMVKLCRWFGVARRSVYYRPTKSPPKVKAELAEPIKALIEADPSFGYRSVAGLLGMNKNTVQRIFQIKGWQVVKRAVGSRPRVEAKTSAVQRPDERWATDLCRVWGGKDRWLVLALVIDCYTRQLLGWHLARTGKATTAGAALEQALIARYGTLAACAHRSCCAQTTAWCSRAATTRALYAATAWSRSSSRRTARSKTAWSSA
ncbi:DDE-type integrase/transposase/recombinase [Dokdonella fugitiva]|jgi:putative transposase|uniref:DDE-type integrase/transposase/recombinase n=1 Tax=Dokdonella fugitiva TaxID=328517 RepID=UPI0017B27DF9|nr:DDE-type integrase/transposase/recombinase [Dokdonella fugitiva]MBA8882371.1 transposase InsO family protein [Dokdonella fugitiva]